MTQKHAYLVRNTCLITMFVAAGCSNAPPEQVDEMCRNYLTVTGISKSTDEAAEVARITAEYDAKGKKLRDKADQDIQGQADVYAQRLSDLEKTDVELTEEEIKDGMTPDAKKESIKAKYLAEFETNKKNMEAEFERFFSKLAPRQNREVEKAKVYVRDRKDKADKAFAKCVEESTSDGVSVDVATCRIQAKLENQYNACK